MKELLEALDEANRARHRAQESGDPADAMIAEYMTARIPFVVETTEMIERAQARLRERVQ